nr:uncharacterized protein LOC112546633 [Pelodiscus sinensis]|eukprot:XP_025043125.1 uncharacterized protein LOC112546633 [Pelodiscus sinensis]
MKKHRLLKNLRQQQRARIALPIDEAIMEVADEIWQTPTSAAPASKRVDRKYFVPAKGLDFLFNHPQPNSVVVDAVQRRAKAPQYKNTIQDKDNKKLDVFGRKVYSLATLLLRVANYMAHLSNHKFDNYSKLTELLQYLPDAKKPLLKAIVQEGYIACNITLQMAMDVADTAARATATGVAMRRSSWLSSAGTLRELQNKVEDLPFEGTKSVSGKRILFPVLPYPKEDRRVETHFGPTQAKPLPQETSLQDGDPKCHHSTVEQGRLVCSPRPARRLLPHSDPCGTQAFSPLPAKSRTFPVQSTTFRLGMCTQSFHQNLSGSGCTLVQAGSDNFPILGRLPPKRPNLFRGQTHGDNSLRFFTLWVYS